MSHFTKVAGTWRESKPYTKVAGTWKLADYLYNKVGGRWYTSFVKGGLVDKSWDDRDQTGQFGAPRLTVIREAVLQSDGKILVGGSFTAWSGTTVGSFVRLNAAGSLDTNFNNNLGTGFNSIVYSIIPKSNGQILIGGGFATLNSVAAAGLVLLNADGTRDTALDTATGINFGNIYGAEIQSDGKILIGGSFTAWKGTTANYFTRINSNGTLDTGFNNNLGTGPNGAVLSVKVQSDGRIIVAGQFRTWNGVTVANGIVRLETTGVRDTAFTTANGTGTGLDQTIHKVAIQSDGKILLGGVFSTWNGTTVGRIVRLESTGALDTAFTTANGAGANSDVYAIEIQSNGKIVVGGDFTSWNGTTVGRIVRLESTGALDTAFTTNTGTGANSSIFAIAIQSDGKIVVGGGFTTFNSVYLGVIVRLNADGTNSDILSTFASFTVNAIAIQSDGKIVVGGAFTAWNGTTVGRIVRLNADGTLDTAFTTNTGTGANSSIFAIAIDSDDKILVGGAFSSWNGTAVGRIVRLDSDGARDTAFTTNTGAGAPNGQIEAIAIQTNGKILVVGSFTSWSGTAVGRIVRLNSNGARDTFFTLDNGTGATTSGSSIFAVAVDSNDNIVIGGSFTSWNGAAGMGRIVRLNSNGIRDTGFNAQTGTGANGNVLEIVIGDDDRILVGGVISLWNGVTVGRIVRLESNGARDTDFTTANGTGANSNIQAIAIDSNNRIVIGGTFTTWNGTTINRFTRLNSDGTLDTEFTTSMGTGFENGVNSITIQHDKKILVGGVFSTCRISSEFRRFFVRIGGEDAS